MTARLLAFACVLPLFPVRTAAAARLQIRTDYSPENGRRARRPETRYIVLHTTEGRELGSLRKLRKRGEAHYFVQRDGRVVRLLDRSRIATHAGRSMWNGRSNVDEFSIGIEVSGFHQREPSSAQYAAIRELLRQLQKLYGIPDDDVLTHSMVAYGAPNRFHPHNHRGRKRCAMVFARPDVRTRLGLTRGPKRDPDVRAGRLRVGDLELHRSLYPAPPPVSPTRVTSAQATPTLPIQIQTTPSPSSHTPSAQTLRATSPTSPAPEPLEREALADNVLSLERTAWSIARSDYASPTTLYVFPDGKRLRGDAILQWDEIPAGTRVLLGQPLALASTTRSTEMNPPHLDVDGLLLVGHGRATARELLGSAAPSSTTTYLFPSGTIRTGAELERDQQGRRLLGNLPAGTRILVGYVNGGHVTANRDLQRIAGQRWNYPSTYYRLPSGGIRTGVEIDDRGVPSGTLVFFRQ
jgi:hypothetical protein